MDNIEFAAAVREKFRASLQRAGVLEGVRVLAAVSGGADSMVMLNILSSLQMEMGFSIAAAHVNHMMRGEAADSDERFVIEACAALGVDIYCRRVNVPAYIAMNPSSPEEAARLLRYQSLKSIAEISKSDVISVAHHADDQAETAMMGAIRGSARLLSGMRERSIDSRGTIVRPMLSITRNDVERYCGIYGIEHIEDASNSDETYTRNRVRRSLLPYIERGFDPTARRNLARLSRDVSELREFALREAEKLAKSCLSKENGAYRISNAAIDAEPVVRRMLFEKAAELLGGHITEGTRSAIDNVFSLSPGDEIMLSGDVTVSRTSGGANIFIEEKCDDSCYNVVIPGTTDTPFGRIDAVSGICHDPKSDRFSQWIPKEYSNDLSIRLWRAGDRIRPIGMSGSKLISDILTDSGVPRPMRDRVPVVERMGEILWIPGYRASEKLRMGVGSEGVFARFDQK